MRLILLHTDVSGRSCADCVKYLYNDRGPGKFGERLERKGKPIQRPRGVVTPCMWCPKIAPGDPATPAFAQELSEKNLLAYAHYLECSAVGDFPNDPIVRRNAAIIRAAIESAERVERVKSGIITLGSLLKG